MSEKWTSHTVKMPPDKAIEYLRVLLDWTNKNLRGPGFPIAVNMAIEALSTPPEADNAPLSLEELRGINNERVWVQFRGIGMYALVAYHADPDGDDGDRVYLTNNLGGRDTYEEIVGQGGDIYRRPPERGE